MIRLTLPVFEEDVFLRLRPFPSNPTNLYAKHWHEFVLSVLFYTLIYKISSPLCTTFFGKNYLQLSKNTKIDFNVHVVGMVQCIISLLITIPMWNHKNLVNRIEDPTNSILGYSPYSALVACFTAGYFAWDLVLCLRYYHIFGIGFLLHALSALYIFGCGPVPFLLPWSPMFLLFELSSPFVNINWFATKFPKSAVVDKLVVVNGITLLITFFSVRIVWGFYAVSLLARDLFMIRGQIHSFFPIAVLTLNVVLNALNIFWFNKMVNIARKKIKGSSRESAKQVDGKLE